VCEFVLLTLWHLEKTAEGLARSLARTVIYWPHEKICSARAPDNGQRRAGRRMDALFSGAGGAIHTFLTPKLGSLFRKYGFTFFADWPGVIVPLDHGVVFPTHFNGRKFDFLFIPECTINMFVHVLRHSFKVPVKVLK
jgi:hypothetical protein